MINYQLERFEHVYNEMIPLLEKHWEEIAHYKDIHLNVDVDRYQAIQDQDMLRIYTARDEQGNLLGYAVYILSHNLHYKQMYQANQDVLFMNPQHRGLGGKLILYCDEQLSLEGVQVVYHHVKKYFNFGPMLEKLGYEHIEYIYARRLDGNNGNSSSRSDSINSI